jgi:mono/diheme cytochrome c family protein
VGGLVCLILLVAACGNLRDQPKYQKPYDASATFGSAAKKMQPEAVAVGFLNEDTHLYQGMVNGEPAQGFPFELTHAILQEGQRQYDSFCAPCHGYSGYGDGVVALEGYPQPGPASFHIDRLRDETEGYFYQVISEGYGIMYNYAARITPEDRWAIIAYIRALQISQNVTLDDLQAASAQASN